jgi:4-carboxymuconolactone decarboxylase
VRSSNPPTSKLTEENRRARKQTTKSKAFNDGLAMRKKVLGADYVEKSFKNADELSAPFQELATEFAWGTVWTRPDLSLRDRSLITLVQCIALNRPNSRA